MQEVVAFRGPPVKARSHFCKCSDRVENCIVSCKDPTSHAHSHAQALNKRQDDDDMETASLDSHDSDQKEPPKPAPEPKMVSVEISDSDSDLSLTGLDQTPNKADDKTLALPETPDTQVSVPKKPDHVVAEDDSGPKGVWSDASRGCPALTLNLARQSFSLGGYCGTGWGNQGFLQGACWLFLLGSETPPDFHVSTVRWGPPLYPNRRQSDPNRCQLDLTDVTQLMSVDRPRWSGGAAVRRTWLGCTVASSFGVPLLKKHPRGTERRARRFVRGWSLSFPKRPIADCPWDRRLAPRAAPRMTRTPGLPHGHPPP